MWGKLILTTVFGLAASAAIADDNVTSDNSGTIDSSETKRKRKTLYFNPPWNAAVSTDFARKTFNLKNAGAQISLFFISYEYSAPMAIEKIKILGAVLELPAKQQCQSSLSTSKMSQIG